jgi:hypothetical protein
VRARARTDANHAAVGHWLRDLFTAVRDCRQFGGGMSDYVVRTRAGTLFLVEVKDGSKSPSRRKLTDQQLEWKRDFGDSYRVVENFLDVVELSKR